MFPPPFSNSSTYYVTSLLNSSRTGPRIRVPCPTLRRRAPATRFGLAGLPPAVGDSVPPVLPLALSPRLRQGKPPAVGVGLCANPFPRSGIFYLKSNLCRHERQASPDGWPPASSVPSPLSALKRMP